MAQHRKSSLPEKLCVACGRPFQWRRRWARDWEHVKYCSERCRRGGPAPTITLNEPDMAAMTMTAQRIRRSS